MKIYIIVLAIAITYSVPLTCNEATQQSECLDIINGMQEFILKSYECIWHNDQCKQKTCNVISSPCDNLAYNGEVCSSSGSSCKGVKNCSEIDNAKSCKLVQPYGQHCVWKDICRTKQCQDNNEQECKVTNGQKCIFMNETCQSINGCEDITVSDVCQSATQLNCIWDGTLCQETNCTSIRDQELCSQSKTAKGRCFNAVNNENGLTCLSCSTLNTQCDCEYYTLLGCSWKNNVCGESSCENYLTPSDCNSAFSSSCTWYPPMKKCMTIYEANEKDRGCDIYSFGELLSAMIVLLYF